MKNVTSARHATEQDAGLLVDAIRNVLRDALRNQTSSEIFHRRQVILTSTLEKVAPDVSHHQKLSAFVHAEQTIKQLYVCYAQILHIRHGANPMRPEKVLKRGFAADFDKPILTPGKVLAAAMAPDLFGTIRADKPWMDYSPTVIFLSDMGDAFGSEIPFEYLLKEVINVVLSPHGMLHIWLWFTKQPRRMLAFAKWLEVQGIPWPENIMPVTSITSPDTVWRVKYLRQIPAKLRGVSAEPLWAKTDFALGRCELGYLWRPVGLVS